MRESIRVSLTGIVLLASATQVSAQGVLDQFSYDGLGVQGVGLHIGTVSPDRLTSELEAGLRVDFGIFAPNIRVIVAGSYFKGLFEPEEIAEFEDRLRGLVSDPTGDAVVQVGDIEWSNLSLETDLQYFVNATGRVVPYIGAGLGLNLRNGSGTAIEDTFVEDALDTVDASLHGMLGTEFLIGSSISIFAEGRASLSSELSLIGVRGGFMYRIGGAR